jgi:hypothetical protein
VARAPSFNNGPHPSAFQDGALGQIKGAFFMGRNRFFSLGLKPIQAIVK